MTYLSSLVETGQIKPCVNMMLEHGHASAYYPRCTKDWASRVEASNVPTDMTAYSAPSSYYWPSCPENCPYFTESDDFAMTASRDQYDISSDIEPEEMPSPDAEPVANPPIVELEPPSKVTIPWLFRHVPVPLWLSAVSIIGGALIAAFLLGIRASQWEFIKQIFGLK